MKNEIYNRKLFRKVIQDTERCVDLEAIKSIGNKKATAWYQKNNLPHEPGLIYWLYLIGRSVEGKKVNFYDIGSAYGYYALVVPRFFDIARITVVEGNPHSAAFISQLLQKKLLVEETQVLNYVLGDRPALNWIGIEGFNLITLAHPIFYRLKIFSKNLVKIIINLFFNKIYVIRAPNVSKIRVEPLLAVLETRSLDQIDVLKIDAEGSQAVFLPPAVDALIARNVLILMEIDRPEVMANFGVSTDQLIEKFVACGYQLFLGDHRLREKFDFSEISIDQLISYERNALLVLLPPVLNH